MNNEIWLSIEEVSALTEEIKETVRRKCKREEYVSTFTKNGRFKVYSILLSSLPLEYQNIIGMEVFNYENYKKHSVQNFIELLTISYLASAIFLWFSDINFSCLISKLFNSIISLSICLKSS